MRRLIPAAILSLGCILAPACDEKADEAASGEEKEAASGEEKEAAAGEEKEAAPEDEDEASESTASGDDKYVLGGKVRPAWVETLVLANESWSLSLTGTDAERATKLALAAVDLAADYPLLLGYSELTIAFAELRRGKLASFERLMVRGLGRVPVDKRHTEIALMAAEQSVKRGRLDPSRMMLSVWRKRLVAAGEDELATQVEDKAMEHLERVRGKRKDAPKKDPVIEEPPADFPIIL